MKSIQLLSSALLLAGTLGLSAQPLMAQVAPGVLSKVELAPGSNYCHLKFPAIREDTLDWDRPVLKDASTDDIIDYYGSCDHDPLGKDEIASQRHQEEYREAQNQD